MEKLKITFYNDPEQSLSKLNSVEYNASKYFEVSEDSDILFITDNVLENLIDIQPDVVDRINQYKTIVLFSLVEPFIDYNWLSMFSQHKDKFKGQKFVVITVNCAAYNFIDNDDLIFMDIKSIICQWKPHLEDMVNPQYNPKNFIKDKKYKFISLTGKPKMFREKLVETLIDLEYVTDTNFITYHPNSVPGEIKINDRLANKFYTNTIITDDSKIEYNRVKGKPSYASVSHSLYQQSFCNIYTEYDFIFNERSFPITEKTFYPMLNNCLNVFWGQPTYYFEVLNKKFGFENYTEINYTPDKIETRGDIIKGLVNNLTKLKDFDIENYYWENIDKVKHNHSIAYKYFYEYEWTLDLYNTIKNTF